MEAHEVELMSDFSALIIYQPNQQDHCEFVMCFLPSLLLPVFVGIFLLTVSDRNFILISSFEMFSAFHNPCAY